MTETRQIRGCCPLDCQDTCAWVATVEDGRVVRVRGAKDHPYTRGVLCAIVRDFEQRTYAPDRLLHPLKRVGPKGSGAFEPRPDHHLKLSVASPGTDPNYSLGSKPIQIVTV